MDKAKQTISSFMSHNDEHKTIVDQDQRAAITEEHVRPQRHEEVTTAIDKEIHQDHHQTILQPIKHSEKLAEKHTHNAVGVQHKTFEHDKPEATRAMIDADAAKYRDSSVTHDTVQTSSVAPTVQGEHIHHHLHQHVQPVIQKDTIAPEVVHTTVPIHETHHAPSVNHGTTTMPAKTLQEFEAEHGGLLKGKQSATIGEFDGCAKTFVGGDKTRLGGGSVEDSRTSTAAAATTGGAGAGLRSERATGTGTGAGLRTEPSTNAGLKAGLRDEPSAGVRAGGLKDESPTSGQQGGVRSMVDGATDKNAGLEGKDYKIANQAANRAYNESSVPRSSAGAGAGAGAGAVGGAGLGATAGSVAGAGKTASNELRSSSTGNSNASSGKVSLKDKLNPFKDADGDGKKGILS